MRKTLTSLTAFAIVVATLTVQARAQRAGTAQAPPADLALTNGRIVTVDDARPAVKAMIGANTQVIDLQGQLAIPGFIESHGHFAGVGGAQLELNLMNVESWEKILMMVA